MKNSKYLNHIFHPKIVSISLILLFIFLVQSCNKKTEENHINHSNENSIASIDFALLSRLNENNFKIIEISDLILNQAEVEFPNSLILEIKNDHTDIRSKLLKLKEENLIITPKAIYDLDINEEVIKNDTNRKFTLEILEKTISNEISDLHKIEETFSKEEFKFFATQTILVLKENQEKLSKIELN